MTTNPLCALQSLGQSVWLDDLRRDLLTGGGLTRLIANDGIRGVTSNPSIFEQALSGHPDYTDDIERLLRQHRTPREIYEAVTFADVGRAADLLRPVYDSSDGRDGFVSIEVSPLLAKQTEATCIEALRLWHAINRANLMIKVPATPAGVSALRRLVAAGVNVNATLLFGIARYREIAEAYLDALEEAADNGLRLAACASVASFFLSRIDTQVDRQLDAAGDGAPAGLRGEAAVACARLAYKAYQELFSGPRWQALATQGARPQRLLWASTSTKDPAYSDIKYIEALIAPDTVSTQPLQTLEAYRDHGRPQVRIGDRLGAAHALEQRLRAAGIDLSVVATTLEREGLEKFTASYQQSLHQLEALRDRQFADTH